MLHIANAWDQIPFYYSVSCATLSKLPIATFEMEIIAYGTGGKHKACRPNPTLHLVLSGPTPCFNLAAASPSSLPLVKE